MRKKTKKIVVERSALLCGGTHDSDAYVGEDRQPLSHSSAVLEPGSQVNKGSGTVVIEQASAPSQEDGQLYVKPTARL